LQQWLAAAVAKHHNVSLKSNARVLTR